MCRICNVLPLNTSMRQFSFQAVYVSGAVHGRDEEGSCRSHPPKSLFSGTLL